MQCACGRHQWPSRSRILRVKTSSRSNLGVRAHHSCRCAPNRGADARRASCGAPGTVRLRHDSRARLASNCAQPRPLTNTPCTDGPSRASVLPPPRPSTRPYVMGIQAGISSYHSCAVSTIVPPLLFLGGRVPTLFNCMGQSAWTIESRLGSNWRPLATSRRAHLDSAPHHHLGARPHVRTYLNPSGARARCQ